MGKFPQIILASASPRRKEIFQLLRVPFEVQNPKYHEVSEDHRSPEAEVRFFAKEKAKSLQAEFPNALIIGSDTLVVLDQRKLGKPRSNADALKMLALLSGKTHRVLSGLAVLDTASGTLRDSVCESRVRMRKFSEAEAANYVAGGECVDKAGAYAIQGKGRSLVESYEGDFFNIVGLPLRDLSQILASFGIHCPVDVEEIYRHRSKL